MRRWISVIAVAALLPAAAPAAASQAGRLQIADDSVAGLVLTEIERRLIHDYYEHSYRQYTAEKRKGKGKNKAIPPGLARKGKLPPGLQKQLARNGTLPPGLQREALPDDLLLRLPRRPADQELVIADGRVLLIRRATNLILDVLEVAAVEAGD